MLFAANGFVVLLDNLSVFMGLREKPVLLLEWSPFQTANPIEVKY